MKYLRARELAECLNLSNITHWEQQELKGKVKSFIYQIDDEKVKVSFNEEGKEIEEYFFEENEKWIFEYEKNTIIKSVYINEKLDVKQIFVFDDKGNLIEVKRVIPNKKEVKTHIFKYDNHNNLIQKEIYGWNGKLVTTTCNQYDKEHHLIEEITSELDMTTKTTYQYDSKNNLTKEYQYYKPNPNSEFVKDYFKDKEIPTDYVVKTKKLYSYDKNDNIIEEITIEIDEETKEETHQKTTFKYDEKENLIEKIEYSFDYEESEYYEKWIYDFDSNGYQILEQKYFPDDELAEEMIREFTFDKYGNWIKYVEKSQGLEIIEDEIYPSVERTNDISIETRTFEYY